MKNKKINKRTRKYAADACFSDGTTVFLDQIPEKSYRLRKDEKLTLVIVPGAGWKGRPMLSFDLSGEGSELNLIILIAGSGAGRYSFEALIRHHAANTRASVLVKSALFDKSVLDFSGNLLIEKNAAGTETYLASHALILSDLAAAKAIPALEIRADDVKAGHAATIGKMDQEIIYYLMSRGLSETEAKKIFIEAFFESALHLIPDEKNRLVLRQKIINLLP